MTEAKPLNYWVSPTALRITLNALSDADYMQASAASGAMIMCYMKGIDGLEFDHGHNYKRWPLRISPTYFTTTTRKYVYAKIPKPGVDAADVESDIAQIVFPSDRIDIYGQTEDGQQIGDSGYYYIYLQGIISASEPQVEGLRRRWEQEIDTGSLGADEATEAGGTGEWWSYNPITDMVTFLKTIAEATFEYLKAATADIHNLNVSGVFDAFKGYIDDLRSHNYASGLLDGAGFRLTNDDGEGASMLEVDKLLVRKKATFMELEIREETFVGGNNHYSPAGSIIYRVEYLDENDEAIGYTVMKVPFLLKRFAFLGRMFNYAARKRVRRSLNNEEWARVHHFRCYLLADDGTTATRNWWKVGDQPRCQTFNKAISAKNKRDNGWNWKKDHYAEDPSTPMPDFTTIEGPIETAYYWRLVTNVGSEKLEDGHMYDFIDMPYEGWSGYSADDKLSFRDGGSGIPVAGDTIVCIGNRYDESRMNTISLYTSGNDNNPPAIKGRRGIHNFSFENTLVWELSPEQFLVRSKNFKLFDDSGYEFPVPFDCGEFELGHRYHWYDRVSWAGSIWLCMVNDVYVWEDAQGNRYETWQVSDIEYGEDNFEYSVTGLPGMDAGAVIRGTDHYYRRGSANGIQVYYIKLYTYSEPSNANDLWLRQVSKGTEIVKTEVSYAASKSGTVHPDDDSSDWKTVGSGAGQYATPMAAIAATNIDDEKHSAGVYLWTRTRTYYDDANNPNRAPGVEYTVVRWGIDADGIDDINSYYLARSSEALIDSSNDNFPMPADSSWSEAASNAKWFDSFADCAAANGGVGKMQGWLVWEKTQIIYDKHYDKNGGEDTNPDIITYKSSRIGMDGQIGEEEYYMLAESEDFNTVFGQTNPTYAQCGIRWYNQSNPAAENYRLSTTIPNINPSMWNAKMPTYNPSYPKKKYLWNFEQRVAGDGTEYATRPICIGNHARGIKGVIELYALSASQTPFSEARPIPSDINSKNTWGVIPTSGFSDKQVWGDEKYDRAPTEALPYQWNWTRTLYSAADENGLTYEDHYHVSAVRGTRGEDGSGVEYIYYLGTTTNGVTPAPSTPSNPSDRSQDDYVPSGWTDNPQSIDFNHQIEWVSERHSANTGVNGRHQWGDFSEPKVWSKWGTNGMDGDGVEYVFIRTNSNSAPTITNSSDTYQSKTYLDDEYLPLSSAGRCTDDPVGTDATHPFEWVATRTKAAPDAQTGKRQWEKYSGTMALWSNYSQKSDVPMQAFQWNQSASSAPSPLPSGATLGNWKASAPNRPGDGYFLWMTQTIKHTAADGTVTYDNWSAAVRISGDTGSAGEDGSDTEWIYTRNNTGTTPSAPANPTDRTVDDYVPSGWTDNPQGVNYSNQYEYASFRTKPSGRNQTWGNFSAPVLWSHWGTNGMDGDGVEYVFMRTSKDVAPKISATQTGYDADEFLPSITNQSAAGAESSKCTDDPKGVSADYPFEWVAKRTKASPNAQTGKRAWNQFPTGDMELWANKGEQGVQGISVEIDYTRSDSRTSCDTSHRDMSLSGGHDTGYTKTAPLSTKQYPFVWQCTRTYNPATGAYSSWSYVCMTGDFGDEGQTGLWYAYAGVWGTDCGPGTSMDIKNTTTQGWYVKYGSNWYMNVMDAGATNTNTPGGTGWEVMTSVFKYYIAEAYFGNYAHLGSFIINGDWMLSTNGKLNGGTVAAYTYFDGAYPMGTRNLDISASGITGTTQTQRGASFTLTKGRRLVKVTGRVNTSGATMYVGLFTAAGASISSARTITSTSDVSLLFAFGADNDTACCIKAWMSSSSSAYQGTITSVTVETFAPNFAVDGKAGKSIQNDVVVRGTIKARLFYGETLDVTSSSYTIDLENNPYYTYIVSIDNQAITLPDPSKYVGCELKFYAYPPTTRTSISWSLNGSLMYCNPDDYYRLKAVSKLYGCVGKFIVIKSMGSYWLVVSGDVYG